MKKLLYITLSFLIFSCNPETVSYTTGSESDVGGVLNGRVNSYSIKTFNATSKFGEPVKGDEKAPSILIETKTHIYNENGDLKERHTMDGYKIIADFDNKGTNTGYLHYDYNGDVIVVRKYELDEQGNIIQSSSYDTDGNLNYYTRNLYNENGENYESVQYDDKGDLSRKTERIYGDSGNLIERIEYDKDEKISSKYTFTYDSISGKKISQKLFKISIIYKKKKPVRYIEYEHLKNTWPYYKFMKKGTGTDDWDKAKTFTINQVEKAAKKMGLSRGEYLKTKMGFDSKQPYYAYQKEPPWTVIYSKAHTTGAPDDAPLIRMIRAGSGKKENLRLDLVDLYKKAFPGSMTEGEIKYAKKLKEYLASEEEIMSLVYEKTYAYNGKGDLILEKENDELKEYKYDYDENDNWVVKYEYLYGKIKYISERTIEYYK